MGQAGSSRRRALVGAALAIALLALASPVAAMAEPVKFQLNATSRFDGYTTGASPAEQEWMRNTYWRMRAYSPFFENWGATDWAPPTHFYQDLYALYPSVPEQQAVISQHPSWLLRDGDGKALYIPDSCNGTSCPAYAADVGNAGYRQWWIGEAASKLAHGYAGIFIDNVNMDMRVSNGAGDDVQPIDPRSGSAMTEANWRRYIAEFTEQIRAAMPDAEITHNAHWWVSQSDASVRREVQACDFVELERGFNDGGLTGGDGFWSYNRYLAHVDWLHSMGKSFIAEPYDLNPARAEFELASYFMVRAGDDAIASDYRSDPSNWWSGWATDLGAPMGTRYDWKGLLRRDYEHGTVLVNRPENPTRTVELGAAYRRLSGGETSSVTLSGRAGAVLIGDSNRPATQTNLDLKPAGGNPVAGGEVVQVPQDDPGTTEPPPSAPSGGGKPAAGSGTASSAGGAVTITVLRKSQGHWRRVKGRRARLSDNGSFRARLGHMRTGTFKAQASYSGSLGIKGSRSKPRRFRIK